MNGKLNFFLSVDSIDAQLNVIHYIENDLVMYGIDVYKKCYAVKVFPVPFDPKEHTFKEHLSTSVDTAIKLCDNMSLGIINPSRRPEITECKDVSPNMLANIADSIKFGSFQIVDKIDSMGF